MQFGRWGSALVNAILSTMDRKETALRELLVELLSAHEMRELALDLGGPRLVRGLPDGGSPASLALTLTLAVMRGGVVKALFVALCELRPNLRSKIEEVEFLWSSESPKSGERHIQFGKSAPPWSRPVLLVLVAVSILVTGLLMTVQWSLDAEPPKKTVSRPTGFARDAKPKADTELVIDDVHVTRDGQVLVLDLKVRKIDLDVVNMTQVRVLESPDSLVSYNPPSHVYETVVAEHTHKATRRKTTIAISQVLDREKSVDRFIVRVDSLCVPKSKSKSKLSVEILYNGNEWTNVWKGWCPRGLISAKSPETGEPADAVESLESFYACTYNRKREVIELEARTFAAQAVEHDETARQLVEFIGNDAPVRALDADTRAEITKLRIQAQGQLDQAASRQQEVSQLSEGAAAWRGTKERLELQANAHENFARAYFLEGEARERQRSLAQSKRKRAASRRVSVNIYTGTAEGIEDARQCLEDTLDALWAAAGLE